PSRILYVGGINKPKGIDHLLRAAKGLLEAAHQPIEVLLIGEGEQDKRARTLATQLGIGDAVTFLGKRPNTEIPLWMNACDLVVLPSLSEGFGVALIEAMACGKPVVATRCGGPEDIVTANTGILVPPGDEIALAKALHDVLSDQDRFDPRKIRRRAVANYAYGNIASGITKVYREVVRA
ncbi:MAG: glycosyl transferase family 1, partial [Chloroflexi bacterium B3_Chlor]